MNKNTFSSEDMTIKAARDGDFISALLDIIDRLDGIIEEWKEATGEDTPQEYKQHKP